MDPAELVGKLGAARGIDRSLLDEKQLSAVLVDDSETGADGAGIDAQDAHESIMN